jgi:hypothetical protein
MIIPTKPTPERLGRGVCQPLWRGPRPCRTVNGDGGWAAWTLGSHHELAHHPVVVTISEEHGKRTGTTHRSNWAWSHELHGGTITKITVIQDLSGVIKQVRQALPSRPAA